MKTKITHKCLIVITVLLCFAFKSNAQSTSTILGTQDMGGQTEYAQVLYIAPSAVITLSSDWTISSRYVFIGTGAHISGPGKLIFDDPANFGSSSESVAWTGQQTDIDGGNTTIFVPVLIRNPNNVVLNGVSTVNSNGDIAADNTDRTFDLGNNLAFATSHADGTAITSNDVVLANYNLVLRTAATLSNYGPAHFVVTNGNGYLYHVNYTGPFIYPVGITDGDYTPASVNSSATNTVQVLVAKYASAPAGTITGPAKGIDRLWIIAGANTSAATIDLQHNTVTNGASYNDGITFVTQDGSNAQNTTGDIPSQSYWQSNTQGAGTTGTMQDPSAALAGSSTRSRTYSAMPTSGNTTYFTKSSDPVSPLPILLASFTGVDKDCQADLKWVTFSEINADRFDVEQSTNGLLFTRAGTVKSSNTANGSSYEGVYAQASPLAYYRLKLVDKDGTFKYSSIIPVKLGCIANTVINVYPNPVTDIVNITNLPVGAQVTLNGINGQLHVKNRATGSQLNINLGKYPKGTYVLRVIAADGVITTTKIIKK